MSQLKVHNHQKQEKSEAMEVDSQPAEEKKCKCRVPQTKSLFASQRAIGKNHSTKRLFIVWYLKSVFIYFCFLPIVGLIAKIPGKPPIILWKNEHANSIHGHQPGRHSYEKETKM